MIRILVCSVGFLTLIVSQAWAICTLPDGVEGEFIYNKLHKVAQYCDGDKWVGMGWKGGGAVGGSVPSGAVMAFDLAECPTGWSAYIQAQGRFLRGIDPNGVEDSEGVRVVGSIQGDMTKNHKHSLPFFANPGATVSSQPNAVFGQGAQTAASAGMDLEVIFDHVDAPAEGVELPYLSDNNIDGGTETRPKNVAVLYCRKD